MNYNANIGGRQLTACNVTFTSRLIPSQHDLHGDREFMLIAEVDEDVSGFAPHECTFEIPSGDYARTGVGRTFFAGRLAVVYGLQSEGHYVRRMKSGG